jgi:hypothetical protein
MWLVHNVTATTKQFTGIASPTEEKCTSVIDSTHCITVCTTVLCCSENNYVNYIS